MFNVLHDLLKSHNRGRWPIVGMELAEKPIKDIEATTPEEDHTVHALESAQEGLQDDKQHTTPNHNPSPTTT
jgi:L-aminopeptidase/D-esterase-like protein